MNVDILKNHACEVCANQHYSLLETKHQQHIESLCGRTYLFRYQSSIFEHAHHLPGEIVKSTSFAKLIKDDDYEITLFKDGRMNVYGIEDDEEAFKLYHSYLKALKKNTHRFIQAIHSKFYYNKFTMNFNFTNKAFNKRSSYK